MKCPYCNKEINDGASFCKNCGNKLPNSVPPINRPPMGGNGGAPTRVCIKCGKHFQGNGPYCSSCMKGGKTKSPIIIILLIVLMVALLGIVGFLGYSVISKKNAPAQTTQNATTATLAPTQPDEEEDMDIGGFNEPDQETDTPYSIALQHNAGAVEYNGHAYAIFNYKDLGLATFDACERYCESIGGHLAVINDQEENDFIYSFIQDSGLTLAFFGYTDQGSEGNWRWVDGSNSTYENWCRVKGKEQPNNGAKNNNPEPENYAEFYKETANGTWNDALFGVNTYRFVCEWE